MNRANEIIEFLSDTTHPDELILAPKAPPVARSGTTIAVAIASVFDSQDVSDTLSALKNRALATSSEAAMGTSGSFSFGIRDVGRFRVNHATQRGSRVFSITRIPHSIPLLDTLCPDPGIRQQLMSMLQSGGPGLLTICGPSAIGNALFAYALIDAVNRSLRQVLYVVERALTFLVKHENSIVIQCELNTDVKTMEEGVHVASLFEPAIMYVGDLRPHDDLEGITRAIENGVLVLLSSVMLNPRELFRRYRPAMPPGDPASRFPAAACLVRPTPGDNLTVKFIQDLAEEL